MSEKPPQPVQQQINLEFPEKEAEGIYSNFVLITHSPSEFILDFARILPGLPKSKVYARVIMTPQHVKSLQGALEENIKKFETQFGQIKVFGQDQKGPGGIGFQSSGSK